MSGIGRYGRLNVVLHPHPVGAYRQLFEAAGEDLNGVRFHGDRFATLSPITETRNGVFTGRLATWTEIDPKSNLIEKKSLKENLLSDSNLNLPDDVGFNSRVFSFAFREKDHQLYVELLNDERQSISVGRARLAILRVLEEVLPSGFDELSVHVATSQNAVEHVFAIPRIRKVTIQLDEPNPDGLEDAKQKILQEIQDTHAKRVKTELIKSSGEETLVLTERYHAMADLAKDNGFVEATGRDDDGEPVERSTKSYPELTEVNLGEGESRALGTRRIAEG